MDRRQRKTRKAIFEAFETLMASEHYRNVTVAQIIEQADIGRSTFYAHFETKDQLLEEICREMFDHIFEGVNEYCVTHPDLATESLEGKLAHLLYHLRDTHSGVCGKLIREGEPIFTNYFEQQLTVLFKKDGPSGAADMPAGLLHAMQVSAFESAAVWWFEHGAKEKPEKIAAWAVQGTYSA